MSENKQELQVAALKTALLLTISLRRNSLL